MKTIKLELTDTQVSDIRLAISVIIRGYISEIDRKDITKEEKELAEKALEKWVMLKAEIKGQYEEQKEGV